MLPFGEKHKDITRFLGLGWNIASFIIFALEIASFIIGLIILFFTPISLNFLCVLTSVAGLIVLLAAAAKHG